jgi:hypothetical protein
VKETIKAIIEACEGRRVGSQANSYGISWEKLECFYGQRIGQLDGKGQCVICGTSAGDASTIEEQDSYSGTNYTRHQLYPDFCFSPASGIF